MWIKCVSDEQTCNYGEGQLEEPTDTWLYIAHGLRFMDYI